MRGAHGFTMLPITERVERWLMGEPAPPVLIQFLLSKHCNLSCPFCVTDSPAYTRQNPDRPGEMSDERLIALAREAAALGVLWWEFLGGEPFYRPDRTVAFFTALKEYGMGGLVTTNGVRLTDEIARTLVEIGWDEITFSLDGAQEHVHDRYRGKGTYRHIVDVIKRIAWNKRALGKSLPSIRINSVITKENVFDLTGMIELAEALELDGVFFCHVVPVNAYAASLRISDLSEPAIQAEIHRACDRARDHGIKTNLSEEIIKNSEQVDELPEILLQNQREIFLEESPPVACYDPFYRMSADICGRNSPCRCEPTPRMEHLLDLRTSPLADVWYGEAFTAIRNKLLESALPPFCSRTMPGAFIQLLQGENHAIRCATDPLVIRDLGVVGMLSGDLELAERNLNAYNRLSLQWPELPRQELVLTLLQEPDRLSWRKARTILEILASTISDERNRSLYVDPIETGSALIHNGDYPLAISCYLRNLTLDPVNHHLWFGLIEATLLKNLADNAGTMLALMLPANPPLVSLDGESSRMIAPERLLEFASGLVMRAEINPVKRVDFLQSSAFGFKTKGFFSEALELLALASRILPENIDLKRMQYEIQDYLFAGILELIVQEKKQKNVFLDYAEAFGANKALAQHLLRIRSECSASFCPASRLKLLVDFLKTGDHEARLRIALDLSNNWGAGAFGKLVNELKLRFLEAIRKPTVEAWIEQAVILSKLGFWPKAVHFLSFSLPCRRETPLAHEYNSWIIALNGRYMSWTELENGLDRCLKVLDDAPAVKSDKARFLEELTVITTYLGYEDRHRTSVE